MPKKIKMINFIHGTVVEIPLALTRMIVRITKSLIMKKVVLGCAVLLSVAAVLATRDGKKNLDASKHPCSVYAINFANDTVPKKDTTKPKKDTMMLAKY
jgi:hypothetical protein